MGAGEGGGQLTFPGSHPSPQGFLLKPPPKSGPAGESYWDFTHIPVGRGTISLLGTLRGRELTPSPCGGRKMSMAIAQPGGEG